LKNDRENKHFLHPIFLHRTSSSLSSMFIAYIVLKNKIYSNSKYFGCLLYKSGWWNDNGRSEKWWL